MRSMRCLARNNMIDEAMHERVDFKQPSLSRARTLWLILNVGDNLDSESVIVI